MSAMCWNATVSLNTFLLSLFAIYLGYINNYNPYLLLFILSFSIMQLYEYFIWSYGDNKRTNTVFSFASMITVISQPIFAALMLKNPDIRNKLVLIYLIGILVFAANSSVINTSQMYRSYKGSNGHLVWEWMSKKNMNWFVFIWYLAFGLIAIYLSGYMWLLALLFLTLIASMFFFYKHETWGSMWCWTANIISLFLICKIVFYDSICKTKN